MLRILSGPRKDKTINWKHAPSLYIPNGEWLEINEITLEWHCYESPISHGSLGPWLWKSKGEERKERKLAPECKTPSFSGPGKIPVDYMYLCFYKEAATSWIIPEQILGQTPLFTNILRKFSPIYMNTTCKILIIIKLSHKYLWHWTNGIIYSLSKYLLSADSQHIHNTFPKTCTLSSYPHMGKHSHTHPCRSMYILMCVHVYHNLLMYTYKHMDYKERLHVPYAQKFRNRLYIVDDLRPQAALAEGEPPNLFGAASSQFCALATGILATQQL